MSAATHSDAAPEGVRPIVRTGGAGNLGAWIFGALLLAAGLALFLTLDARREQMIAPATTATSGGGMIAPPPPLPLPQAFPEPLFAQPERFARNLPFPVVTDPAAPPLRPQRHIPNSIATVHCAMVVAIARMLPRCPCCARRFPRNMRQNL